ncbi:Substrate-binding region of ABC-type glycine betaine transport system [Beutenbergia cavernae DSM 12333]|uniref:Substrate-binding region of ABC-type glycine betaine transport system n=1 Tax=Beutenbergia cavernae (strain ATCC BAA-8 / DSM 12333 / CCUG 43141 / JCM 11478 / NBRC 16432 / NCIMB 13614 / HKI 0122) TaxID=471853 RepID=C5BXN3_BEUC1|nr:glycine betaine ABC transporter substrate-binding protein [Beutenbergia cavernae]ACQ80916.1 Substrate-binding region of ABC-type glycine betaine transport system [Beutenbergia cavernae DSM 12333]
MRLTARRLLTASVGALAIAALAACGQPGSSGDGATDGETSAASETDLEACEGIADQALVVLEDDQGLQTADNIVPAIHADSAEPALVAALDAVSAALDTEQLIELNKAVDIDRQTSAQAAEAWWDASGVEITDTSGSGDIVVGSANFSENITLGEIYRIALTEAGYSATTQDAGNREIYLPSLQSGDLTVVPEYLGTLTTFLVGQADDPGDLAASSDVDATYEALSTLGEEAGLAFGQPSAAADQNAFAVTQAFADEHGVATLSELAEVCGDLALGGPPECPERPFCQPGLEETYGLQIGEFTSLDAGGPLTKSALQDGSIALGLVFSSDAALATE